MATEPQTPEIDESDEELVLDAPLEGENLEPGEEGDGEEEVLVFGDETEPHEGDNGLVKHLREEIKKRDRMLAEKPSAKSEPIDPGPEPTLEDCEYDEELYRRRLREWDKKVEAKDAQTGQSAEAEEEEKKVWLAELDRVNVERAALPYADSEDAFETVKASLSIAQQAALIQATDAGNTAKVIYALGKHPEKLAALAGQTNLIKFIKDVTKLEGTLKMVKRRKAPEPEEVERGSARVSHTSGDKKLKKLEEEAARTGDRTELQRYRKSLKQAK